MSSYDNHHFMLECLSDCEGTDILEFGVYSGDSLHSLLKRFREADIKYRRVFGFDSFRGLKLEESDKVDYNVHEQWADGSFDARKLFKADTPSQVVNMLNDIFRSRGFDVDFITGQFSWLDKKFGRGTIELYDIQPALYINIDCDLYSAAKHALNFIFDNDLLAVNGLIRYDDYNALADGGEALAHKELAEERGLVFEYLDHCVFKYKGRNDEC